MRTIQWKVRGSAPSEWNPRGTPPYEATISLTDEEFAWAQRQTRAMKDLPPEERAVVREEVALYMEMKAEFQAEAREVERHEVHDSHEPHERQEPVAEQALLFEAEIRAKPDIVRSRVRQPRMTKAAGAERDNAPSVLASKARARSTDPGTSHAAARSITPESMTDNQRAVLDCFRRYGAMHDEAFTGTYDSFRDSWGWPKQAVSGLRTRRRELADARLLQDSGKRARLPSKRLSIVWELATEREAVPA